MADSSNIDPALELALVKREAIEREKSDAQYAKKMVEYIVYAVIAAAAMRVVYGSFDIFIGQYFRAPATATIQVTPATMTTVPLGSSTSP